MFLMWELLYHTGMQYLDVQYLGAQYLAAEKTRTWVEILNVLAWLPQVVPANQVDENNPR